MSRIGELIREKCPVGVEYKKIADICLNICSGGTPNSKNESYYMNGTIPWLRTQEINFGEISTTELLITEDALNNSSAKWIPKDCVIVAMYGATVGKIAINKIPLTTNQACCNLEINPKVALYKYVFYCLSNQYMYIKSLGQGSQTNINAQIVKNLEIPVPPIEIQMEIVRILDKFTELEAELQAELDVRKKQYEYYREKLILNAKNVEIKTLEEIATDIYRGAGIKRDETTLTGIPCVRYGEIYTSYNISFSKCVSFTQEDVVASPKYFEYGDILFAITGESIEDIAKSIAYLGNDKCICGGDIVVMKHKQEPRYISYALSTYDAIVQKGKGKVKSKVVHSSVPAIQKIRIPVPPMDEQVRIADKLDAFLTLIYDDNKGLLAEIDARHKQYEYYRDKLLTFERKVV